MELFFGDRVINYFTWLLFAGVVVHRRVFILWDPPGELRVPPSNGIGVADIPLYPWKNIPWDYGLGKAEQLQTPMMEL